MIELKEGFYWNRVCEQELVRKTSMPTRVDLHGREFTSYYSLGNNQWFRFYDNSGNHRFSERNLQKTDRSKDLDLTRFIEEGVPYATWDEAIKAVKRLDFMGFKNGKS